MSQTLTDFHSLLRRAATWVRGFVNNVLRVPFAFLGNREAVVHLWNSQKTFNKTSYPSSGPSLDHIACKQIFLIRSLICPHLISDLDIELVTTSPKLATLMLEENPLTREAEAAASSEAAAVAGIEIRVTKRELEDWEDLNI